MKEFGALIIGGWGLGGTQGLESTQELFDKRGIPSQLHFLPTSEGNIVDVQACQSAAQGLVDELVSNSKKSIVVAYSLGAMFVANAASNLRCNQQIDLAVFVAPWTKLKPKSPGHNFEDRKLSARRVVSFVEKIGWQEAWAHLPDVRGIFSANDYFVDYQDEQEVMRSNLGAQVAVLPKKGHFLKGQFPLVGKIISNYLERF